MASNQIQPFSAKTQPNSAIFGPKLSQIQPFSAQNMVFLGWKWLSLAEELILRISGNQVCSDQGLSFPRSLEFQPFSAKNMAFFGWKWLSLAEFWLKMADFC